MGLAVPMEVMEVFRPANQPQEILDVHFLSALMRMGDPKQVGEPAELAVLVVWLVLLEAVVTET